VVSINKEANDSICKNVREEKGGYEMAFIDLSIIPVVFSREIVLGERDAHFP